MHRLHKTGRAAWRIVSVFSLMFVVVVYANAYTVVMRSGRRIEIPARFVVSASTLTYETAPGIQITLNLATIDIPATEKANNEPAGSLLKRAEVDLPVASDTPTTAARRTITNLDLQSTALRRRQSELAYESRRKQLGLPSVEESRERAARESELIAMELEENRLAQSQTESYWRERAAALRTEMAALDAEIGWIRARLDEGPAPLASNWNGWGSFSNVIGVAPFGNFHNRGFGNFGGRGRFPAGRPMRPSIFVAPNRGARLTGRVGFGGGATRGRVFVNPGFRPARPLGNVGGFPVSPIFPSNVVFGSVPAYDFTYERGALITRFNELGAARAGLNVRWRELEEEARRAGAPPGWLRP